MSKDLCTAWAAAAGGPEVDSQLVEEAAVDVAADCAGQYPNAPEGAAVDNCAMCAALLLCS